MANQQSQATFPHLGPHLGPHLRWIGLSFCWIVFSLSPSSWADPNARPDQKPGRHTWNSPVYEKRAKRLEHVHQTRDQALERHHSSQKEKLSQLNERRKNRKISSTSSKIEEEK